MPAPRWAWPEPDVWLEDSVIHVDQAHWVQDTTFLEPVEGTSKWLVLVEVDGVVVHGSRPSGIGTTIWSGEMPYTTKHFSMDLSSYGVFETDPLAHRVAIEQYAGFPSGSGQWWWASASWEPTSELLRIYIDSRAGRYSHYSDSRPNPPPGEEEPWLPLMRALYDEWVPLDGSTASSADYAVTTDTITFTGPNSSRGMQFQVLHPHVTIDGVQIWVPEYWWAQPEPNNIPDLLTARLWDGTPGSNNTPVKVKSVIPEPGWNNIMFDTPYDAQEARKPGTPTPGNPYPYVSNDEAPHNGWYIVGVDTANFFRWGQVEDEVAYNKVFPEHERVYVQDNFPALSNMVNRFQDAAQRGPEWSPQFGRTSHNFVGPIMTYTPIYAPLNLFVPQIYRRVIEMR